MRPGGGLSSRSLTEVRCVGHLKVVSWREEIAWPCSEICDQRVSVDDSLFVFLGAFIDGE